MYMRRTYGAAGSFHCRCRAPTLKNSSDVILRWRRTNFMVADFCTKSSLDIKATHCVGLGDLDMESS